MGGNTGNTANKGKPKLMRKSRPAGPRIENNYYVHDVYCKADKIFCFKVVMKELQ